MLSDAQRLLVGMCRSYMLLEARFGKPGQRTWVQFPSIQGHAMRNAVETIAALPVALEGIDVERIVREMAEDNEPPAKRPVCMHGIPRGDCRECGGY